MVEQQSSNRNIIIMALAALLFAVVAVGIVLFFVLSGDGDSSKGAQAAESAKLMPVDSFMFMAFNPHLDQAANYTVIEKTWGENEMIQEGLDELLNSMQQEGLDYKTDIEPWIGDDMAFSMGDLTALMQQQIDPSVLDVTKAPSEIPEMLFAMATQDQAASDKFLDDMRAEIEESGTAMQETEYQGVKIVYYEPEYEGEPGVAYATVEGYVVLAVGGVEPLKKTIDASQGEANLANSENYQDILAELPKDQVGYGYMDMGAYMKALMAAAESELAELPPEVLNQQQLEGVKSAGFSFGFEPNGMRMDFTTTFDPEALSEMSIETQANDNKALNHVPADTLLYLSGSGMGNVIQGMLDVVKAMPDQPEDLDEQIEMLTGLLGVSMEELVEMLSGEFAMAFMHDPAGLAGDPSMPIGMSMLIEAEDQEKFQKVIRSLSSLIAMGGEMELPQETINDVEVTMLTDPSTGEPMFGWGVGDEFFALGSNKALLKAAFGGSENALADDETFKAATSILPTKNTGYFYLNMGGLMNIVYESLSPREQEEFDRTARTMFEPIRAMAGTGEPLSRDEGVSTGTLFILIEEE